MSKAAIFLSGLFFGGAIDHAILAAAGRHDTPYGVDVRVAGNWGMAGLDLALAVLFWQGHRWSERRRLRRVGR
jgi:hypothetical protein